MHSSEIRVKDQSWCCGSRQRMAGTFERHQIKGKGLTCNWVYKKTYIESEYTSVLTSKPYALEFFKPLSMTRSSPKSSPSPLCLFLIACLFLSSWNALCFSPQPLWKKEKIKNEADCSNSWRANNAKVHTAICRPIILPASAGPESQKNTKHHQPEGPIKLKHLCPKPFTKLCCSLNLRK